MSKSVLTAAEIAETMDCSESMAYKIIYNLNKELQEQGYIVRWGRVSRKYFAERTGLDPGGGDPSA